MDSRMTASVRRSYTSQRDSCTAGIVAASPKQGPLVGRCGAGFTILELVVVLSIIVVLSAVVLPAVQRAREGVRQVQCKNNLHQIGVALHSYHAAMNCFPPGWIISTPVDHDSRNGWGWLAMLLPSLDQGPVFNGINFDLHLQDQANQTVRTVALEAFICPSDLALTHL